jgi:hypothetical protein
MWLTGKVLNEGWLIGCLSAELIFLSLSEGHYGDTVRILLRRESMYRLQSVRIGLQGLE